MRGVQDAPARLLCGFDLEAQVPDDPMLRQIDRFRDVGVARAIEASHQPS